MLRIESVKVDSLRFDPNNARKHSDKNLKAISGSLEMFGQRKPIVVTDDNVVVAGNGTLEAAISLRWNEIDVVRVPADWTDEQVKAFALADNRSAELAEWDEQVLASQLLDLEEVGLDIAVLGFEAVAEDVDSILDDDSPYTSNVEVPKYEPTGDAPDIDVLADDSKYSQLMNSIAAADVPDDVAMFLRMAASRHIVFDYAKIAEYYAHADAATQRLFEESALIILDVNSAIEHGYLTMMNVLEALREQTD